MVTERNTEQSTLETHISELQRQMNEHGGLQEKYTQLLDDNIQLQERNNQLHANKQMQEDTTLQVRFNHFYF